MCGRCASFLPPEFLARLFAAMNPLPNLQPTWNLAPTDGGPVIRLDRETGARHLDVLKWGLIPYFTKDLKTARHPINARSDTVARSGMFKVAFAKRRCLVPTTAYYEWRDDPDGKTPFAVARLDGEPVVFGGIWEHWRSADGNGLKTRMSCACGSPTSASAASKTTARNSSNSMGRGRATGAPLKIPNHL
jgi:putative SOS response-associated peptidase YedK